METMKQAAEALHRKKELFEEYEVATRALLDCEVDDMTDYITKRSQLAIEIDKIDAEMRSLCDGIPRGALLGDVIANRCAYNEAPMEWKPLFEAGQAVLAVVSRIVELETSALDRIRLLQVELKQKIADTQNTPKIARYLSGMSERTMGEAFIMDKA